MIDQCAQRPFIAVRTQSRNLPDTYRSSHRFMPESFPCMNVAQMNFNGRKPDSLNGIADGNACMSVGRRIDDNPRASVRRSLRYGIHQISFVVGLEKEDFNPQFLRDFTQPGFDRIERNPAVNFHFPAAQQLQVRTIQH